MYAIRSYYVAGDSSIRFRARTTPSSVFSIPGTGFLISPMRMTTRPSMRPDASWLSNRLSARRSKSRTITGRAGICRSIRCIASASICASRIRARFSPILSEPSIFTRISICTTATEWTATTGRTTPLSRGSVWTAKRSPMRTSLRETATGCRITSYNVCYTKLLRSL